jgi:hypothetical protein
MGRALTPRKSDMLRHATKYPKNNYFCYRWRVVDNFSKSIDREQYHQQLFGGEYYQSLQNERILALYKMTYHRRKNDFLSKLTQDARSFLDGRRTALAQAVREESAFTKSMATQVDSIFNILLSCSIELNTVLGFSELFVAATEPEVQTYTSGGQTKVRSLHCRFSTNSHSLVLHGRKNRIDVFVLPVEDLLGAKNPGEDHEPMAVCIAETTGEDVVWNVDIVTKECEGPYAPVKRTHKKYKLTEETMETLCHFALKELIESTQMMLSMPSQQTEAC